MLESSPRSIKFSFASLMLLVLMLVFVTKGLLALLVVLVCVLPFWSMLLFWSDCELMLAAFNVGPYTYWVIGVPSSPRRSGATGMVMSS